MSTAVKGLERRYRRLLASYPLQFRARHGDELVAVMLNGARDGQRYPKPREAADLIVHGLLTRVRSRRPEDAAPAPERKVSWGDALAASSVHGLGPAPIGSWTLPRWLKWLAVLLAVLAVPAIVVSLVVGAPHLLFEHALAGYGGSGSATGAVGQTTYHGLPVRPTGSRPQITTLEVSSLTPRITVNTAHATVSVLVCTGRYAGALAYGGVSQDAARDCPRLSAFRPGTIRIGTSIGMATTGVLVAVTPHQAGTVRIEGADVTYRQGFWHRHQHVGMDWTLHVP
jgi:hypothetical protein